MPRPRKILFVCTNERPPDRLESCGGHHGSAEVARALSREVKRRGLKGRVKVTRTGCLGVCRNGPHAVVMPDACWYRGIGLDDVEEVVAEHLEGGRPVERLRAPAPPAGEED